MTKETRKLCFVIQKHHATSLHFDFRLEINGAMASWAIPKGVTLNPKQKRLAMKVEDHKMDWNNFEGVIPEGEYGAGSVMIWDNGIYIPEMEISPGKREQVIDFKEGNKVMDEGVKKGEIKFFLEGKKTKGSFALVRTKGFPPGTKNAWLLIKHQDDFIKDEIDFEKLDYSVVSKVKFSEIK